MFDFKELINDLFNNNSCYSCCNNKNEKNAIIIPTGKIKYMIAVDSSQQSQEKINIVIKMLKTNWNI